LIIALFVTSLFSRNIRYIFVTSTCFVIICIYGKLHLSEPIENERAGERVQVRIVQPNVQIHHFGNIEKKEDILKTLTRLTLADGFEDKDYIFWPEAAFPYPVSKYSSWLDVLKNIVPPNKNAALIFGADRVEKINSKVVNFNSIIVIDRSGYTLDYYDKQVLVPFGEYVPYKRLFLSIGKIAYAVGTEDIAKGSKDHSLTLGGNMRFLPLICSESTLDKNYVRILNHSDYRFILNVTNDSWFGESLGPYQHFAASIVRSIEYGLPVIRAANTGISGIINPFGKIMDITKINTKVLLDGTMPGKLKSPTVFYYIGSFIIPGIFLCYAVLLIVLCSLKNR
jgi:apolipoprotein N-acyltransferase